MIVQTVKRFKSFLVRYHRKYGCHRIKSIHGFSLLELTVTLFLTSILCSMALYTSMAIWHMWQWSELKSEQNGMNSNLERTVAAIIHGAKCAACTNYGLHFVMVGRTEYTITLNSHHQLVEYMPKGGETVLADCVDSYNAVIDGLLVTVQVKLHTGYIARATGVMLGGVSV